MTVNLTLLLINSTHIINNIKGYQFNLIKQQLTIGDYEIDGRLLVERKTLQET